MITVNLLPHHLRPIKRTPLPYILSLLAVVIAVGAVGFTFVSTQAQIMVQARELDGVRGNLQQLDAVIKEAERLQATKKRLADKIATINDIVAGRIIWSYQLDKLARLAPENLWYSGVKVDSKQFKEDKRVLDPNTKKMTVKTEMVKHPILRVSGYVAATPTAPGDVSAFALAADADKEFSDLFTLETQQVSDTEFGGAAVRSFTLEFRIRAGASVE